MKRILFLCDVDGTLVSGGKMSPAVIEAAREFTSRGHLLALATGRHKFSLGGLRAQLPINAPCVILAGAAVYDPVTDTCRRMIPMEEGVKHKLGEILKKYPRELAVQVFTARTQFNLQLNDFMRRYGIAEEVNQPDAPLSALEGEQILKIGFGCEDTAVLERCAREFFSDTSRYEWQYSSRITIEVCHPAASKGNALRGLLSGGDIRADIVAVAGDSANDLSMFSCADIRFAPSDAIPEIRAKADYVVSTAENGCAADALRILMSRE